ncbi:coagulation factor 10 L homeolog precursor [Xenopus laevis]|uniref:coagulation factor Xa n=2 Tax=Xenopus laevis TaxID=8355 RepID=Q6PAG2_XENLA|nr:coagulation factor 10 L homeolog precursor [Xenopus laevis]AAH60330.1 MGC68454 protein [Xenopus laevis]OCT95368.1 hypothetical protein XELAEV_18013056mg [Xenopus laevis]
MAGQTCLLILIALPAVLLQQATNVFLKHGNAHNILRAKRANSGFEEFKKGNLERECYEERCSFEEAREVFENEDKTREFWNKYYDDDQCKSNPCQYGGSCKDGINEYTCFCNPGFEGKNCETVKLQLCSLNNGDCDQFCKVVDRFIVCSCTNGYVLGENGKSCIPTDKYSCGRRHMRREKRAAEILKNDTESHTDNQSEVKLNQTDTLLESNVTRNNIFDENEPNVRIVGGRDCDPGECPWQALLVDDENEGFCGGTILSRELILTAAHCINQTKSMKVVVGALNTKKTEGAVHNVEKISIHPRFVKLTYDYDMAVIKLKQAINFTENIIPACIPEPEFAEQVLMNEPDAMVSGFGRLQERGRQASYLQMLQVPYIKRHRCKESSTFAITDNMFCAGFDTEVKDACQGDSGGPHVTPFKGTYFVTGIVSWGEGCARKGKFGVYTKVSKLNRFLKSVLKKYPL